MFVWWGDDLVNLYNDAYKSIVGGKHPAALGEPAAVVWHEIWDQIAPRAATAMRDNEGTYDESLLLVMERYGYEEETYYTFSYSPVPNDRGGTGGIICANTDNTQRIISERQMLLLRDLAASTADARTWREACKLSALSLGTNAKDLCFALIYVADGVKDSLMLAGSSGIESDDKTAPALVAIDDAGAWPFAAAIRSHEIQVVTELEARLPRLSCPAWDHPIRSVVVVPIAPSGPNGRAGALVVGLNPFRQLDDGYRGFLKLVAGQISAGIANASAYEEERRRAEVLAELDRAKTTFFSNVSHEFRTPLTLMLGPLEEVLASGAGDVAPRVRRELEVIHRNGLRLLKLVNALLDFSRIEAGRVDAHYEPVDLAAFTAELASVFRSAMQKAKLEFRVSCEPLPEKVYLDREMWEKVVFNLLSNALKFTSDGGVELSLRAGRGFAELTVRDTGIGIPEQELPRIFERFHRVAGARGRTHEGTGIGLALVDELVKLHGGSVVVQSQMGDGTSFRVKIPFGSSHLPSSQLTRPSAEKSIAADASPYLQEALRWLPDADESAELLSAEVDVPSVEEPPISNVAETGCVLLVDDNRDMREYVSRLLETQFDVICAGDGVEALQLMQSTLPDLVLTDVMMPRMDGFELLKNLRSDSRTATLPVIMLSARAGEESRVEGVEAGADDYLVKPFTARELIARVSAHLSMKRLREELSQRERQQRERAEAAEAQYRRILESISEGFMFVNHDWSISFVNESCARMVHGTPQQLIGANFWEQFPQTDKTDFGKQLREAMHDGQQREWEEFYEPLEAWFRLHVYPSAGGLSVFLADVTVQRRQREALLISEKLAAAGRLASTVAHEINNPLESVINLLYLARSATRAEERDLYFEHAEREINRVAHIARQALGFYRDAAQVTQVSLASLVENLLQVYQGKLKSKRITVRTEIDDGLQLTLRSGELNQVLSNLVTNSIDACRPGGSLLIRAAASSRGEDHGVELTVTDDGTGIPQKDLPKIFEPFFTTKKDIGTGLGLWVVKQIVEGNRGDVVIESSTEEGRNGTTVRLFWPESREEKAQSSVA